MDRLELAIKELMILTGMLALPLELRPSLFVPSEVELFWKDLMSKLMSKMPIRKSFQYAASGCRSYIVWELMVQEYGSPADVTANPYELLITFFEAGGMYETEHNLFVEFF